jgi:hypothetical protein
VALPFANKQAALSRLSIAIQAGELMIPFVFDTNGSVLAADKKTLKVKLRCGAVFTVHVCALRGSAWGPAPT